MVGVLVPSGRVGRPATREMKIPAQCEKKEIFSTHRSAKVQ